MRFDYVGDTQKGILSHLKETLGDAQYYQEVLTYTSSNNGDYTYGKLSIDFDNKTYWVAKSKKQIGEYIIFHFPNYFIKMSGYSIRTSHLKPGYGICHPKNFGFDASNDNETWIHQVNYTDINNHLNKSEVTEFIGWNFGTFKYFRFMITGEQHDDSGKHVIDLAQIEFFGDLLTHKENLSKVLIIQCKFNFMLFVIIMNTNTT